MQVLDVIKLSKSFDKRAIPAFKELNFSLDKGKILSIFGPSGTGKSTLLKIIAGEIEPDSGEISLIGGVELVASLSDVDVSKTSSEIIGEKILHLSDQQQVQRKREMVDFFSLFYKEKQPINTLSLGEQKRVLLARSLAPKPAVLLLDEPFSSLDLILKNEIKQELREACTVENIACLFVSHNFVDIMDFSDRVAILDVGQIRQIDSPKQIYDFPRDAHVAKLIQNSNLIACEIISFAPKCIKIKSEWGVLSVSRFHFAINDSTTRANLLIYPHELEIDENGFEAKVIESRKRLGFKDVVLKTKTRFLLAQFSNSVTIETGQVLKLRIKTDEVRLIPL
ncbi:MAG: ABC transporter ATP-binding protein [Bacteriovoracaceae bacterium]|jgi:ABC-type Fe3+/spermidine/putrescine transport system ATPase subunit|nr:ABC transporter ATP-binding protein [Bacteriovoracaceae bacterium]